jgi:hypothetical protein
MCFFVLLYLVVTLDAMSESVLDKLKERPFRENLKSRFKAKGENK